MRRPGAPFFIGPRKKGATARITGNTIPEKDQPARENRSMSEFFLTESSAWERMARATLVLALILAASREATRSRRRMFSTANDSEQECELVAEILLAELIRYVSSFVMSLSSL